MPSTLSYPGVYIEEIPSGVRSITGVATSITAFVGRAARGPVDNAVTIYSYADFERTFGGLWLDSSMSYAVRDYFRNGGSTAVIVRVTHVPLPAEDAEPAEEAATASTLVVGAGDTALTLQAANPGSWGDGLVAIVDHETKFESDAAVAEEVRETFFNLTVQDASGTIERFVNLSTDPTNARFVVDVLEASSSLVRVASADPDPDDADDTAVPLVGESRPAVGRYTVATDGRGSDGETITEADLIGVGFAAQKRGLYALERVDLFNLLCIPPFDDTQALTVDLYAEATAYCTLRRAVFLVDGVGTWTRREDVLTQYAGTIGVRSRNAAMYFPWLRQTNPLRDGRVEDFPPCGAVAGIIARTDAQRGVWKAPAGQEAVINGSVALSVSLTDMENGELNTRGFNCLRTFAGAGRVVWGARTREGDDALASEWKYLPVRRTALFLEESLYRGLQWVVFEPNDEPLWAQIRLNVGAFLNGLFRQGAFQGASPREAYFVKCDRETTTQADIDRGVVNVLVGFAPLKPAEFVVLKLQQMTGQAAI